MLLKQKNNISKSLYLFINVLTENKQFVFGDLEDFMDCLGICN